jgi:hypothetical protein
MDEVKAAEVVVTVPIDDASLAPGVHIFVRESGCLFCVRAKKLLRDKGVAFKEVRIVQPWPAMHT